MHIATRCWRLAVLLLSVFCLIDRGATAQTMIADLRTGVASDGSFIAPTSDDDEYVLVSGPIFTGPYPRPATVAGWISGVPYDPDAQHLSANGNTDLHGGTY